MEELGGAPNVLGAALLGKSGEKLEGNEDGGGGGGGGGGGAKGVFGEEREEWEGNDGRW